MTKFLLDSGDPQEYKEIAKLAKSQKSQIWGATTNPTLIAKTLSGRKLTQKEAFEMQKEIVIEILDIVPGAVSAEVYADESTTAEEMIEQGVEMAKWDDRIYVKLPTTLEGFKARTALREKNIPINNTLIFSQQQIFAIALHEKIIRQKINIKNKWPPFISPFVGRLDDKGENGMQLIENGMKLKGPFIWMLAASIRKIEHIKWCIDLQSEIITAPAKTYREWFMLSPKQRKDLKATIYARNLKVITYWQPSRKLLEISTIPEFMSALEDKSLDIEHPMTTAGLARFVSDWKYIISEN